MEAGITEISYCKTDLMSAFRILPLKPSSSPWLILKAQHPVSGKTYFFVERNLPFGSSISCSHFQRFSNAVRHIFEHQVGQPRICTNYLDDFLIFGPSHQVCNQRMELFLSICKNIGIPVALEKTEWATHQIVFLGLMLNGTNGGTISVPEEKNKNPEQLKFHNRA